MAQRRVPLGDDRIHQIAWYGGEADTTPSLLVATGRAGGGGGSFVRYTMKVSKEMTAQPQIEALWWQAYRGGSYDGFEEAGFTCAGTLALTPFLALFTPRLKAVRRRLPRSSSMRKAI